MNKTTYYYYYHYYYYYLNKRINNYIKRRRSRHSMCTFDCSKLATSRTPQTGLQKSSAVQSVGVCSLLSRLQTHQTLPFDLILNQQSRATYLARRVEDCVAVETRLTIRSRFFSSFAPMEEEKKKRKADIPSCSVYTVHTVYNIHSSTCECCYVPSLRSSTHHGKLRHKSKPS